MEHTEAWFTKILLRLLNMNDVVDIDELAGSGKKVKAPVVDAKGLTVSTKESSRVPIHVPNAPPAPQKGGKCTPLAAPPGTLA